jgi:gluconate 2-dehydrogenase gamma chain
VNRRDALKTVGLLLGTAVSPSVACAVRSGYRAPGAGEALRTLSPSQGELVATLTELIIPTTDTPGARAAGVHAFIDGLLTDIFTAEERERFLAGLSEVDVRAERTSGATFLESAPQQQVAVLSALEREPRDAGDGPPPFFGWLKELTLVGYYTSEVGAAQELSYVHVAGSYDGDIPYEQVGRAYS